MPNTIMGTFADTAILASHHDITIAASYIQEHLDQLQQWMNKWRVKVNEAKSTHVIFELKRGDSPTVRINDIEIPQKSTVRYLGLHLDNKLHWREHIQRKKQQIVIKTNELNWPIRRKSKLSLKNRILIYKAVNNGIELWGWASKSHTAIIQRQKSQILRQIVNAPWYITNCTLHHDLSIPTVQDVIKLKATRHISNIADHPNSLLRQLLEPVQRRLKRQWPTDIT
jgi:hypothetical protein